MDILEGRTLARPVVGLRMEDGRPAGRAVAPAGAQLAQQWETEFWGIYAGADGVVFAVCDCYPSDLAATLADLTA